LKVSYQYDPADPIVNSIGKHIHGQWRSLTEMIGIAIMFLLIWFISDMILDSYEAFFAALSPQLPFIIAMVLLAGITMGLIGAYLTGFFVSQFRSLISDHEAEKDGYRAGPVSVEISEDGVATLAPHIAKQMDWKSVSAVIDTPGGLGLRLDDRDFIPVPDNILPEGMMRTELADSISKWREQK
jgi:hypothetical protein